MRVAVTGATGTIGRALADRLRARGDEVVALSRDADRAQSQLGADVEVAAWDDPAGEPAPADALAGTGAVVNLMGAPVEQRWSDQAKRSIRESRVAGTHNLVDGIAAAEPRPSVLVSQSASGWYGARGDEWVSESEPPAQDDFLADVVVGWEREARRAEELELRVTMARTGVVLSESGGALDKMLPFFKLGIGGPVAGGKQYVPWLHVDDAVAALVHLLDTDSASGPVNVCAPEPATNGELSKTLGGVLRRPAFAPVPGLAVKALYGGMAQIVTTGVRMDAGRLRELGFHWRFSELEAALRSATGG